jgi:FtsP/CotA-like multicopper oxidase with cupredoxin domain
MRLLRIGNFYALVLIRKLALIQLHYYAPAKAVLHDASFTPHAILRVTEQKFTQSCMTKPAVALINGTSPGPEIRLVEGRTFWIRVYNDMEGQNLTMVPNFIKPSCWISLTSSSTGMV